MFLPAYDENQASSDMKTPLLVKILDDLTAKGLLVRVRSDVDRRRHYMRLTDAGSALRSQIRECHFAGNTELFRDAGFSVEETTMLLTLLRKLANHIQSTRRKK